MKMRKSFLLPVAALVLFVLVSIPAYGDIASHTWLGAFYSGYDGYYNRNVVAYQSGSIAVLEVTVQNNRPSPSNISVTRVYSTFDWGSTYNSSQVSASNSALITNGASHTFSINFTVPNVSVASNLYLHSYTIFADYNYKNQSNTSQIIFTRYQSSLFDDFAVYSSDQASAVDLNRTIQSYPPLVFSSFSNIKINNMTFGSISAQAEILWNEASNETASAYRYYTEGNFAAAEQSFSNALNDKNQAFAAEQSYLTSLQSLQTQQTQAETSYLNALTSFFNGISTMWVLLGIGWVLLSIGYIVKWLHKRPEPQTATA